MVPFPMALSDPNLDFKVAILYFERQKVENGPRKSYGYNGRLVENHISSIKLRHFQWPWMTLNVDFKGTSLFNV